MSTVELFAPAKLNLFLAITGRRADGFHDLVSVVAQLEFGDDLACDVEATSATGKAEFSLTCDDAAMPTDESNLVLKAAQAFAAATGWTGRARFRLTKRIPMGAGLGGGSSDGVAALRALNRATGDKLGAAELVRLVAGLGSDCPLFLAEAPIVMRGRGERVDVLPEVVARRLQGRRVLVFKPAFGIPTPWAYGQLAAAAPAGYLPAEAAEARLAGWLKREHAPVEELLFNNMEPPAFAKFVALPVLLERLQAEFGLAPRMSGSGSACFAFLPEDAPIAAIMARIRAAWGDSAFVIETRIR